MHTSLSQIITFNFQQLSNTWPKKTSLQENNMKLMQMEHMNVVPRSTKNTNGETEN